jgi:uncharacterized protein YdeI (YjbR/CyaY-like superfamily)
MDPVELESAEEWRRWLSENHLTSTEVWLVIRKGKARTGTLTLKAAMQEAICFGWIDSRTKRLDDQRYMLRVTPRKESSGWSGRNLGWARELIDQGKMTDAGMAKLPPDFREASGGKTEVQTGTAPELEALLGNDQELSARYAAFAPGQRREFNRWILGAKRPETRRRRVERTAELIRSGRSLTEAMMERWSKG